MQEVNNWGVAHALRLLLHHTSQAKLQYLIAAHERGSDAEFKAEALERFGKVRSKTLPALRQIERIADLAERKGYKDVLALLNEALPLDDIPTDPREWND